MNERCGCGAAIEEVNDMEHLREWRKGHRHEPPKPDYGPSGGQATTERGWAPTGFVTPDYTDAMKA